MPERIEIPAAPVSDLGPHSFTVTVPPAYLDAWNALRLCNSVKKSSQLSVRVGTVRKPRTTGKHSQNSHLRGHEGDIALQSDGTMSKQDVHDRLKENCVARGVLRFKEGRFDGKRRGISEADMDTVECAEMINEAHLMADEYDLWLVEMVDDEPTKCKAGRPVE